MLLYLLLLVLQCRFLLHVTNSTICHSSAVAFVIIIIYIFAIASATFTNATNIAITSVFCSLIAVPVLLLFNNFCFTASSVPPSAIQYSIASVSSKDI